MGNNNQKNSQNINKKKTIVAVVCVLGMLVIAFALNYDKISTKDTSNAEGSNDAKITASVVKDNNIVIPLSNVSETATFYPAEMNGTKLEVLAVEAPDGSIRTAFNTCQVCFSSGRGYYVQEGDVLVCQNCGNRFQMEEVEITRGGCNPVPITSDYKTVTSDEITISKEFLTEATVIFGNWKN